MLAALILLSLVAVACAADGVMLRRALARSRTTLNAVTAEQRDMAQGASETLREVAAQRDRLADRAARAAADAPWVCSWGTQLLLLVLDGDPGTCPCGAPLTQAGDTRRCSKGHEWRRPPRDERERKLKESADAGEQVFLRATTVLEVIGAVKSDDLRGRIDKLRAACDRYCEANGLRQQRRGEPAPTTPQEDAERGKRLGGGL